jgi:hypothetical protein
VRAHRLDPDLEPLSDLGVRAAVLEQLQDVRLARGERGALHLEPVDTAASRGRARKHVHPARREVDRVDDVARLGVLRQAARGAKRQHLRALRRGRLVGEHHDARVGEGAVQPEQVVRAAQRAKVEQHHGWLLLADDRFEVRHRHVVSDQLEVRVILDHHCQADRNEVLEVAGDYGCHGRDGA